MQHSLRVTSAAHYISSEYYRNCAMKLQCASVIIGALGATGSVSSGLAWKMQVLYSPRVAPIFFATSATSFFLAVLVPLSTNIERFQSMPANLHQMHFRSGIECQYLEKQAKFISETEVWDSKIEWASLSAKYKGLLRDKKEVNRKIQTDYSAYREALKQIENREREKRERSARAGNAVTE